MSFGNALRTSFESPSQWTAAKARTRPLHCSDYTTFIIASYKEVAVYVSRFLTAPVMRVWNLVELVGLEPTASSLRTTRSPN